jgi:hypothetical protein
MSTALERDGMRTTVRILLVAMLLSACARGLAAEAGKGSHLSADDNNCIKCHGEEALWEGDQKRLYVPAESLANDVHFKNGVNCHDCHGGDPSSMEVNDVHSIEAPKDQTAIVGFRSPFTGRPARKTPRAAEGCWPAPRATGGRSTDCCRSRTLNLPSSSIIR